MKKTKFFLMALLLVTVLVFTSCGSRDDNQDAIPDDRQNNVERDVENGAEDLKDDAENIGDDVRDGVDDAADDVKDAVDDDNRAPADDRTVDNGDVSKNTADNGTRSNVQ